MTDLNYLETSGWLKSLTEGKSIDYNSNPLPWYSSPAIEFIEDKLRSDFRVGVGNQLCGMLKESKR